MSQNRKNITDFKTLAFQKLISKNFLINFLINHTTKRYLLLKKEVIKLKRKRNFISSEKQLEIIEKQVKILTHESLKENPDLSPKNLAEKITETWYNQPEKISFITFLEVKPCFIFKVGFRGEKKEIHVEL